MLEVEQDKETGMSFEDFASKFLVKVEKPKPRPKTWEEIVDNTIDEQIRIANGEFVKGSKKNADGQYPSKASWFKDGEAKPKIGIMPIFPTDMKFTGMSHDDYKTLLNYLKDWRNSPQLVTALNDVKSKKEENDRRRKEKSA